MRLDEPDRRSLYAALAEALGDRQADTLMNLLPTHPLADMATRDDLNSLAIAMRGEMAELRGEMALGFGKVDRRFGEMQAQFGKVDGRFGEIDGRFGEVQAQFGKIDGQFGNLRAELAREMRKNTVTMIMMMFAIAGIVVALSASGALN